MSSITLTVFFEDPFWVGIIERADTGALQAVRHVFGGEPSPGELTVFVNQHLLKLFEQPVVNVLAPTVKSRPANPKRAAREAARILAQHGASSKAQEAIHAQLEQFRQERHVQNKAAREAQAEYKREIKVRKAKARHRGH